MLPGRFRGQESRSDNSSCQAARPAICQWKNSIRNRLNLGILVAISLVKGSLFCLNLMSRALIMQENIMPSYPTEGFSIILSLTENMRRVGEEDKSSDRRNHGREEAAHEHSRSLSPKSEGEHVIRLENQGSNYLSIHLHRDVQVYISRTKTLEDGCPCAVPPPLGSQTPVRVLPAPLLLLRVVP